MPKRQQGKKPKMALVPQNPMACEFCLMLASREPSYTYEFNPHGKKNHNCKCKFMAVDGKTRIEGHNYNEYYRRWQNVKKSREKLGINEQKLYEIMESMGIKDPLDIDVDDFVEKAKDVLSGNTEVVDVLKTPYLPSTSKYYDYCGKSLEMRGVKYNPVRLSEEPETKEKSIEMLSGGDETYGSCQSLALAYIGRLQGWDVLDFRGGKSQEFFSRNYITSRLCNVDGIVSFDSSGKSSVTYAKGLVMQCEAGKEYLLAAGKHTAIVRRLDNGTLQYLELQSETESGWIDFGKNPSSTLKKRFGCSGTKDDFVSLSNDMICIDDSEFNTDEFRSLLGYLNTSKEGQKKGTNGATK